MTIAGQTMSFSRDERRASAPGGHPPVIVHGRIATDGVYPIGLLLKRDVDGITFIQAAEGDTFAGVLDKTIDTTVEQSAAVVIHGAVQFPVLVVGAVAKEAPSVASILALQKAGIFPQ